ncbi:MAG: hypothetical protein MUC94_16580 [bacterium]|nr:hypothetical protein [bacterium]
MKIFNKQTFEKLKDFVIKHHIKIVLIAAPIFAVVGFVGMIYYNQIPSTCLSCHYVKGPYVAIDLKTIPHQDIGKKGAPGCMECHPDKAVEHWAMRGVSQAQVLSQRFANLKFTEPTDPSASYTSDQCLKCHPDRLDVMERDQYLLPTEKLAEIGLMLNKRLHYRYEMVRPEEQQIYQTLQEQASLTDEESQQLELIEKIKLGNCGQCHLREKVDARNPITCAGCHENVTPMNHPGKPLPMPTEEVCQKCHHGKIHGKFVIFRAECEDLSDQSNCTKCHPYYVAEKAGNWVIR